MAKLPEGEHALPSTAGDAGTAPNAGSEHTEAQSSISTEPRDARNETAAIKKQINI